MSTMLREVGTMVQVLSLVAPGKRRKIPRKGVWVPKDDIAAIQAEAETQAAQARKDFGIDK